MASTGFLEQKPRSPTGFGLVLLLHGAAIAGVLMIKGPELVGPDSPLVTKFYELDPPPPPVDVPPTPERQVPEIAAPSVPSPPEPLVRPPVQGPVTQAGPPATNYDPTPAGSAVGTGGTGTATVPIPERRPPPPVVRTDALFDPRYAGDMQPPYPSAEQRAEREGQVRIRVTIGANGRVVAATRLSATNDAFWRATERQALSRWRFRPATVDGRPVESSKTLTVHFRLDGS